jgi:hypothetical protein
MTDQDNTANELDDVEGHAISHRADAEFPQSDDDTEGHRMPRGADAESAEADDDTEGHRKAFG